MANLKKNDTGLRVLEILKSLISCSMSADGLIKMIEAKDHIENIYTKETLAKYFNTMELVGLKVVRDKKDGNFCLKTMPVEIELNKKDIETLCLLEGYVAKLYNKYIDVNFNKIVEKLKGSFSNDTKILYENVKADMLIDNRTENLSNSALAFKFERFCVDGQKLKIAYVNRSKRATELYTIEPKSLIYEDSRIYLLAYNPALAQNQKFLLENIVQSDQLPQRNSHNSIMTNVVFELKAPLSNSYKLKEGEKIIHFKPETVIVSNSLEDKNILFKRLLRYGENCKIIHPRDVQIEFRDMVNKMVSNLRYSDNLKK